MSPDVIQIGVLLLTIVCGLGMLAAVWRAMARDHRDAQRAAFDAHIADVQRILHNQGDGR